MTELEQVKQTLEEQQCQIVWKRQDETVTSFQRGIGFLLQAIESSHTGGFMADKVVGKAAAFLMVSLQVQGVFAKVISVPAAVVLKEFNIPFSYQTMTDRIANRTGDGLCPMEQKVWDAKTPAQALSLLRESI